MGGGDHPAQPGRTGPYSCPPERSSRHNDWLRWADRARTELSAYLFWGAEYWVMRDQQGDSSYLDAFARLLDRS